MNYDPEYLAEQLVNEVKRINPSAWIVKNWEKGGSLAIDLVEAYYAIVGEEFLKDIYDYLIPQNFK